MFIFSSELFLLTIKVVMSILFVDVLDLIMVYEDSYGCWAHVPLHKLCWEILLWIYSAIFITSENFGWLMNVGMWFHFNFNKWEWDLYVSSGQYDCWARSPRHGNLKLHIYLKTWWILWVLDKIAWLQNIHGFCVCFFVQKNRNWSCHILSCMLTCWKSIWHWTMFIAFPFMESY